MAHSVVLLDNLGLVVLRFWGDVKYDEIRSVFDESVKLPGFRPKLKAIADCRDATTQMSGSDIQRLASYAQKTDPLWGESKWAILAPNDVIFGLSRMFSALTSDYEVKTHVFRTIGDANDWLEIGVPLKEILLGAAE